MANILRIKGRWSGFSGAPGYTVLHFRDFSGVDGGAGDATVTEAEAAALRTRTFFDALKANLSNTVRVQVEGDVEVIDEATGRMVDLFTITPPAEVVGTNASGYAGPVGAVVNWRTGAIRNGRRIRGRSFLVPLALQSYAAGGILSTTAQGSIAAAATALADSTGSPDLGVYARPSALGATDGQWAVVTQSNVPSMAAVLRSRRD